MPSFPPIHPAFVHFPIALVVFSVFIEFIAYFRPASNLKALAKWAMVGAAVGGVITVTAGYVDLYRLPSHSAYVHFHMQMGWLLLTLLLGLAVWRWFIDRMSRLVPRFYLCSAAILLLLTMFQGWVGGELVFSHGVAVAQTEKRIEPTEFAQARLKFLDKVIGDEHEEHGSTGGVTQSPRR